MLDEVWGLVLWLLFKISRSSLYVTSMLDVVCELGQLWGSTFIVIKTRKQLAATSELIFKRPMALMPLKTSGCWGMELDLHNNYYVPTFIQQQLKLSCCYLVNPLQGWVGRRFHGAPCTCGVGGGSSKLGTICQIKRNKVWRAIGISVSLTAALPWCFFRMQSSIQNRNDTKNTWGFTTPDGMVLWGDVCARPHPP